METVLYHIKRFLPDPLLQRARPAYHRVLAFLGALIYRFPSRKLTIVGITGTKGKSSTAEIVNAVLEEAGYTTALASTIRFKIGNSSRPNLFKMTMPGRFFMQKFLRDALRAGCTHAVLEMTSEGTIQFRHKHIALDTLIFTNLSPEHIEAHGSYEAYFLAKFKIAKELERSPKQNRAIISNNDDEHGRKFLAVNVENILPYSLSDAGAYTLNERGADFVFENTAMHTPLVGVFNIYNAIAAMHYAKYQDIPLETVQAALLKLQPIKGRVEYIDAGQKFSVVVDYAHTPHSLEALYKAFADRRKICVLGNTGGGRDRWKRPEMGAIAEWHCDEIILTNEDPYDEEPRAIVEDMARGMTRKKPSIIMDRRRAIRKALSLARDGNDIVLITGKGTDPYIMGARNAKVRWSDAAVARDEIEKITPRKSKNKTPEKNAKRERPPRSHKKIKQTRKRKGGKKYGKQK